MQVDGPRADGAAARRRDARLPEAREQRTQHEERRAHRLHELVGRLGAAQMSRASTMTSCPSGLARTSAPRCRSTASAVRTSASAGTLRSTQRSRGEQRREEQRQRRVLRAAHLDLALERTPPRITILSIVPSLLRRARHHPRRCRRSPVRPQLSVQRPLTFEERRTTVSRLSRAHLRARASRRRAARRAPSATSAPQRIQARPAPPASACRGSSSRTSGSSAGISPSRRYGGFDDHEVDDPGAEAGEQVAARRAAPGARGAPALPRATASAARGAIARPDRGRPAARAASASGDGTAARADVEHAARAAAPAPQRRLDQQLGLRPRDQHAPVDGERQRPELALADHVRHRLAPATPRRAAPRSAPRRAAGIDVARAQRRRRSGSCRARARAAPRRRHAARARRPPRGERPRRPAQRRRSSAATGPAAVTPPPRAPRPAPA